MPQTDPITPPIKDTKPDRVLTSQELIEQLNAERADAKASGKKNEKIHALLERAGLLDLTKRVNEQIYMQGGAGGATWEFWAPRVSEQLEALVDEMKKTLKKNPNYRSTFEVDIRKEGEAHGASAAMIEDRIFKTRVALDFTETFKDTFKKGIDIRTEDVPYLLEHFGLQANVSKQPQTNQNRR